MEIQMSYYQIQTMMLYLSLHTLSSIYSKAELDFVRFAIGVV